MSTNARINELMPNVPTSDEPNQLLRRMDLLDKIITAVARRGQDLDFSIVAIARDYLLHAREEYATSNFELANESLLLGERVCAEANHGG
jgi:hypothetical protein